jgi:hypothetical protein
MGFQHWSNESSTPVRTYYRVWSYGSHKADYENGVELDHHDPFTIS